MGDTIRLATPADAAVMAGIYRPYVEDTAVTFEVVAPSGEEFANRIAHILERYPWLVAERDGEVAGYAYAGPLKARAAYDHSVEVSIYLREGEQRRGLGRRLYEGLETRLRAMGMRNLYACITYSPDEDDPFLTRDSIVFHERMGFARVGLFHDCGLKFDRLYSVVWMEKVLARA